MALATSIDYDEEYPSLGPVCKALRKQQAINEEIAKRKAAQELKAAEERANVDPCGVDGEALNEPLLLNALQEDASAAKITTQPCSSNLTPDKQKLVAEQLQEAASEQLPEAASEQPPTYFKGVTPGGFVPKQSRPELLEMIASLQHMIEHYKMIINDLMAKNFHQGKYIEHMQLHMAELESQMADLKRDLAIMRGKAADLESGRNHLVKQLRSQQKAVVTAGIALYQLIIFKECGWLAFDIPPSAIKAIKCGLGHRVLCDHCLNCENVIFDESGRLIDVLCLGCRKELNKQEEYKCPKCNKEGLFVSALGECSKMCRTCHQNLRK